MNRQLFFDSIRESLFAGHMSSTQVDGVEALLDKAPEEGIRDDRQLAYVLATVYHETSRTFKPIEEYGLGRGRDYGKKLDIGQGPGKRVPYTTPDQLYYGRGFCQLTWKSNYEKFSRLLDVDLVNHPELALDTNISAMIILKGMRDGVFTGRKLSGYINDHGCDFVGARSIINGKDSAEKIAAYAQKFLKGIL